MNYLKREEQKRSEYRNEISHLKEYYLKLKENNKKLKSNDIQANNFAIGSFGNGYLDSRLQVESEVMPFESADLDRNRFPRMDRTRNSNR